MSTFRMAMIGNPNCGKTTLFNGLTGAHQKVGNWPGVTIERKEGHFRMDDGREATVIDLPGIYSLEQDDYGVDEQIARDFLSDGKIDLLINVVDANTLDRQLLLTHQLREFNIPMLVVVNMMDVAQANDVQVDVVALSEAIGLPVVGVSASRHSGVRLVRQSLPQATVYPAAAPPPTDTAVERISRRLAVVREWHQAAVTHGNGTITLTDKFDRIVLNRFLGVPIFLLVMYLLFTFAINIGAVFIDFFDILLGAWLVDGLGALLSALHAPGWLVVLLADGLGGGIQLVGTFIPVIGFLYLGLAFLESSGYIVRAAFVVDRLMQSIGLPGKAFVPLIVGFGCNVPSIMATRTMSRESDRLVTMAMAPFMSCGARLTVYALFGAAFFGSMSQNVVFGLYLFGILVAVATGWVFRKWMFRGELSSSIMEMPQYHIPSWRNIVMTTWHRLRGFVERAGKTIVTVVVVLSFLNSWGTDGSFGNENSQRSVLSQVSQWVTPVLSPMGVQSDNWPATVGIITGIFAKEAVVGTLDALYADVAGDSGNDEEPETLWQSTQSAFVSIWDNAVGLGGALTDPLGIRVGDYASLDEAAAEQEVRTSTLQTMVALFVSPFAAFCYLVFILLYTPCVASMGALVREAGSRWAWLIVGWSTVVAYAAAVSLYQLGTLALHPLSSLLWVAAMAILVVAYVGLLIKLARAGESGSPDIIPTQSV
ncbi:ferrous iron transport protein B [Reinekea blandensis]|uniref:Ferrous iron transport protein B n=1 Tax=Reinekea blandensis MED297 TaxID=314283 RepID=A4BFJ7_9GAMM|nr:ferrous iron transport protein B [Reinekea blandensis]EAR09092.1 Ferrous iron transport protein B [Reinekea sp. MED297] [Reinekea blandensis MED297]